MAGLQLETAQPKIKTSARQGVPGLVQDLGFILFFFLATVLFYWRIITPDLANRASFPKGDFIEQFYAFAYFRAQELLSGHLPLWNPYAYGGHPFIADIQSAVFYPISWITAFLAGKNYPLYALEIEAIFHIFLAGVFAYFFGIVRFRSRVASAVSGIVFAFGGYLTSYPSQQLAILEVQIWLPLILLLAHLATQTDGSMRRRTAMMISGGLFLGISALAGHPQAFMYVLYGTTLYLLFRLFEIFLDEGKKAFFAQLWIPAIFVIIGLGLAAVQFVPTYEFMGVSSRAKLAYNFTQWGFPVKDILQIVLPGTVSDMSPMYVGILPLILAIVAIRFSQSRQVIFWSLLALTTFLLSFGGHTFLYSFFYLVVPGFSTFRDHERAIYLTGFALAQLAGYGTLYLSDSRFPREWAGRAARVLIFCLIGVAMLLAATYMLNVASGKLDKQFGIAAFLALLLFLNFLLLQVKKVGLPLPWFQTALILLIVFDLFSVNWKNNLEEKKPEDHYQVTPLLRYLQEKSNEGRVANEFQMPLNYGDVYGVEDVNGASPLIVDRYKKLMELPQERFWQIMNVRYFLTWQGGYPEGKKISVEKGMNLYELPNPLPRAVVFHDAKVEPKDDDALGLLSSPGFDPSKTVVLAEAPGLALPGPGIAPSKAVYTREGTDKMLIEASIDKPGILFISEVLYPGWKVKVDGVPERILRANVALSAVPLEAGNHSVEMYFDPDSHKLGAGISATTLLLSLITLGLVKLRPEKQLF